MKSTIEMALEADCQHVNLTGDKAKAIERLERFAELIRADEREACAKVCAEDNAQAMDFTGGTFVGGYFAKKIIERNKS